MRRWYLYAVLAAALGAWAGPADASSTWAGTWSTAYEGGAHSTATVTFAQDGSAATGSYEWNGGQLAGTDRGAGLSGTWTETYGSGSFQFTLGQDGRSFTGWWSVGTGGHQYAWSGTCVAGPCLGNTPASACALPASPPAATAPDVGLPTAYDWTDEPEAVFTTEATRMKSALDRSLRQQRPRSRLAFFRADAIRFSSTFQSPSRRSIWFCFRGHILRGTELNTYFQGALAGWLGIRRSVAVAFLGAWEARSHWGEKQANARRAWAWQQGWHDSHAPGG